MEEERRTRALAVVGRIAGRKPSELEPQMHLQGDLGIDSPEALRLLMDLEDDLGIEISDEDAARIETVGDVLTYAQRIPASP